MVSLPQMPQAFFHPYQSFVRTDFRHGGLFDADVV